MPRCAKGVVVATGAATEIGRISGMLSTVETLTTPLVDQMGVFLKWLTIFILIVAALLLVFGYFVGHHPFPEMFMAVVGLSVAAIPEGLPAVLTITLAIGVQAMARRNAIVRRLPAIEALGSVSVICTDKTGTLTRTSLTWGAVRGTKVVWLTVAIVTVAQFSITYIPILQKVFATEAMPLLDGVLIVGIGVALFALIETEKQLRLRLRALSG